MVEKAAVKFNEENKVKDEKEVDDRHGEIGIIDYNQPRPKVDANAFEVEEEVLIGQGTFAKVYRCSLIKNGKYVAVKKLIQNKKFKSRELQIHKEMYHMNIVRVFHAYFTQPAGQTNLNIVMDFIPTSVFRIQKEFEKLGQSVHPLLIKVYGFQLFRALNYIHKSGVCHRDIKPQNLLVDPSCHVLKVCDFGSSKKCKTDDKSTSYITTRYYRAPELVFGSTYYGTEIDIWSAGCVIAELMCGAPFFRGETSQDMMLKIIEKMGTPTKDDVAAMNPDFQSKKKLPKGKTPPMASLLPKETEESGADLLEKLFKYKPGERLTALQAMAHPYFDELREENLVFPTGNCLCDIFSFTQFEMEGADTSILEDIIPEWYLTKKKIDLFKF